jgi:hypothetical protein
MLNQSNKLQEFRGLDVQNVAYYDAKATTNKALQDKMTYTSQNDTLTLVDTQGATITKGDSTGTVLLDASGNAMNLSSKQTDTIASGHEVGEVKYLQNGNGVIFQDSYDTKEAMNDAYGAYYTQRLNEATNGGISDVPYSTNTNTPSIKLGTNTANGIIIPDNGVEYKTMVYIWKGVGHGESAFGHVSASVNDTSYSFGPNGMDIRPLEKYLNKQIDFRSGIAVEIPLTAVQEKKFESFLKSYDSPYWVNYCPSPVNQGLHELGYKFDSQIIPMSLYMELMRNNIGKNPTVIQQKQ